VETGSEKNPNAREKPKKFECLFSRQILSKKLHLAFIFAVLA
jgi:hypothetical protein